MVANGLTIIMATQYLEDASLLCDKLYLVENGSVVKHGSINLYQDAVGYRVFEISTYNNLNNSIESSLLPKWFCMIDEHKATIALSKNDQLYARLEVLKGIGIKVKLITPSTSQKSLESFITQSKNTN